MKCKEQHFLVFWQQKHQSMRKFSCSMVLHIFQNGSPTLEKSTPSWICPMNFPTFLPLPPTHLHIDAYLRVEDLCGKKSCGVSPLGKAEVCFLFFFNAELLTSSLSERFHILLTSPFVDWFKPKRRPWPHLNDDSTNSGLCTRFLPLEKFPSGVINQIFAFPLSR